MINKAMIFKKRTLSAIFILVCLLALNGCKSKKAANEGPDIKDATWYLKLPKEKIKDLLAYGSGNDVRQLYFEFKIHKNNFALNVFGYDSSGKEKTGPIALEVLESEDKVKNPNGLTRRAQIINRGSIRDFMGIGAATGPIDPTKITRDMYFKASVEQDPRHPGKKLMFFFFSDTLAKLKAAAAGDGSTNPSPPANACVGNCDNADYK